MVEEQVQRAQTEVSPVSVFRNMIQALNRHDIEAMVSYFAQDFRSEQPFHPERSFIGQDGVRKNWSFFFATVPDIHADILNEITAGNEVWAEVHFHGIRTDGKPHTVRAVSVLGIAAERISWTRMYTEQIRPPSGEMENEGAL